MATSINLPSIRKKIFAAKAVQKQAYNLAVEKIEKEKQSFLAEYENHPVTIEISAGPSSANISNTLGGRGNLFSFIGFDESSTNPTTPVEALIKNKIFVLKKIINKKNVFIATVRVPDLNEFSSVTRMPWEAGRSWLLDMEKRISGLGSYLFGEFRRSRSGRAIQTEKPFSSLQFRPVKYFRTIYLNFINKVQK